MELLRHDQLTLDPGDVVHREAVVGRVIVLAVFASIATGWLILPLFVGPWGMLGWPIGALLAFCVANLWPGVRRGFGPRHWAVRLRSNGIAVRIRSYLNDDLAADDPTVCWIPSAEIRSIRCDRTRRLLPGSRHRDLLVVEQHLDVELVHDRTQRLGEALARERRSSRRGRAHHSVYPVRVVSPNVVRITWRDPRLALRPGLHHALAFLGRHYRVEEPLARSVDWRKASEKEVDDLVLELCVMGSRMEAVSVLRLRRGMALEEARRLVEQLAA